MKIRHKLTGEEFTISRLRWDDEYLPKKLEDLFDILEDDCVILRVIMDNGDRKPYKKFDRDHAIQMIKADPLKYDFVEWASTLTEDEKIGIILKELNDAYPGYLYVKEFAGEKFKSTIREEQILVDRLLEEDLAKSLGNPDHRMQITTNGIRIISSGGYIKFKQNDRLETDSIYNPEEKFTEPEKDSINNRLDELAHKLERIETGQRLIYDDIIEQIEELKKLSNVLSKKTWGQTLKGKLIDWGLGELTEKGFDLLTQTFKDDKLLNS